ncbi:MFS transporter [Mycetocola lacteus]|uniref:MFS transporter n=1 Tax=Mycetocola lacteus TaxID=76637 RepID=A0A3L7AS97_9MICO|nr:MFS transporter [Mycetocola lacteus]RLP83307.1 MFS transporter [Mycetocola lacteus]
MPTPPFRWSPVLAVALSTFSVVTAEMMPVGLLTPIADALDIAPGLAGMSLTITGIMAAVVAALTPVILGRLDRRTALIAFLILLAVANVLSAVATMFAVFALARVLIGISMGIVWASSGGLGARLADAAHIARAMTAIFSGVSIGMVLGLPLGTLIANLAGWRTAFWALAALGAFAAIFARIAMPALPTTKRTGLDGLFSPWRDRGVRTGYIITALVVIGHFGAYTFIRPVLETNPETTPTLIVIALAVFGLTGIAGNFAIGAVAGKSPRTALLWALAGIAIGTALIPLAATHTWFALLVLAFWGAAYGGIGVALQAWIRVANPAMVESSSSMWSGVFNGSIAIGSLAGGLIFDLAGGTPLMLLAALIVAIGWVITLASRPVRERVSA